MPHFHFRVFKETPMNFEEFAPAADVETGHGHETGHSEPITPDESAEPAAQVKPHEHVGFMDRLAQSSLARTAAFLAAGAIGGGALSGLSGCSMQNEAQVMRTIEKEVKFSTFGADAKVTLDSMPQHQTSREGLKKSLDNATAALNGAISSIEETHTCSDAVLKVIQSAAADALKAVKQASTDTHLASSALKLTELGQLLEQASKLTKNDFSTNIDSAGYQKISRLQGEMHDWGDVLGRDLDLIRLGMHAREVALLNNHLEGSSAQLKTFLEVPNLAPEWLASHGSELTLFRAQLQVCLEQTQKSAQSTGFTEISQDLGDVTRLLKDVLHATDHGQIKEFFTAKAGESSSAGQALVKEASKLVDALKADMHKELASTLGAQAPQGGTPNAPVQGTSGTGGGTQVVHHYHSSPNFLTWYLLMNHGGGYHGSYTYVPNQHYGYSGSSRFRSSPEYSSFSHASHDSHSVLGGKAGVESHASGTTAGGRGVSSSSGSSTHIGSSSSSRSSPSHFGGSGSGFSGGKSFSSGFGG